MKYASACGLGFEYIKATLWHCQELDAYLEGSAFKGRYFFTSNRTPDSIVSNKIEIITYNAGFAFVGPNIAKITLFKKIVIR